MPGICKYIGILKLALFFYFCSFQVDVPECVSGNCNNGIGTIHYSNGARYTGMFENGKCNGLGTYTDTFWGITSTYVGQFKNNKWDGYGTLSISDGSRYEGEFMDGRFHGQGVLKNSKGVIQKGLFLNDQFVGDDKELKSGK